MLGLRRLLQSLPAASGARGLAGKARPRREKDSVPIKAEDLRATMRKLAFMVHPDRASGLPPTAAAENAESLSQLQGLLSTVQKSRDSHPPAAVRTLRFHVQAKDGGVRTVQQVLRTTGGDCRKVVSQALSELFGQLGLPRAFRWGEGAWDVLSEEARAERDNRGGESSVADEQPAAPSSVPPAYDAAAVASPPKPVLRDAQGKPQDLAAALRGLDPLLNAIAVVPWLPRDAEGAARRHYIIHHVVRELATQGWALERGAAKVWAGARDADALAAEEEALGVDGASAQALKMVVFHARQLEKELGPPQ